MFSGDGKHLAIPGKMSEDNSPAVCVWNVRRKTRKFLYPTSTFCPFRWFEKVAVSRGRVYGLLNRRCLFSWDAESGEALFNIDLTESYPGLTQDQPVFTYLSVYNDFLATINKNPSCQVVYQVHTEDEKAVLKLVLPQLNMNWLKSAVSENSDVRICDVRMNEQCIIVHLMNLMTQRFEAIFIKMNNNLTIEHKEVMEDVLKRRINLESTSLNIPGQLSLTSTKMLNITPHQLCMYDFLV